MKQVININFQGRVVPIEVSAHEILKQYIESLSRHFAAEEGKDEIINDIENRIGELFQERIKDGATCITDEDVQAIIRSIGRPEDFETEETSAAPGAGQQQYSNAGAEQHSSFTTTAGKRLFRDENHKFIGGVCSGVANYFNIDVVVVRIVFLIAFFCFGFGFIPYIILWIAVPSSSTTQIGSLRKKMYRDTDDKWIGGVCSGLAHYFGINVWILRLLFLIPFLSFVGRWGRWGGHFSDFPDLVRFGFSPGAMFIYIILWLVLPEANSTAEKLEMKGEKVDMNSIKNSVAAELRGVQERAQKFGKEAASFAGDKGKAFGAEAAGAAKRGSRSLGDIIVFLVKLFGYFILGTVGFALIVALFAFGISAIGIFPMKDFVISQGWETALAWGTLIFFIIVPMIGVITWVIRRLAKIRTGSKMLRLGFGAMWVVGWVCIICLVASVEKDFREEADINEQEVYLPNPTVASLEVTTLMPGLHYTRSHWFRMDPFEGIDEDTAFVRNISVHIIKSPNDSFRVTMVKLASGRTKRYADSLASEIKFNVIQQDSTLVIDRAIPINKIDKFRNQKILLTVYVPVGKQIMINRNVGWDDNIRFMWSRHNNDWENIEVAGHEEQGWDEGQWYNMTAKGLYTLDGKPVDDYDEDHVIINSHGVHVKDKNADVKINEDGINVDVNHNNDSGGSYRYRNNQQKTDTVKPVPSTDIKHYKDSLRQKRDELDKMINKSGGGTAYNPIEHDPTIFLN